MNYISFHKLLDKLYIYKQKDTDEPKSLLWENKREQKTVIKNCTDLRGFYLNIDEYTANTKSKILIAYDDFIEDMVRNRKSKSSVTYSFIRDRKLINFITFSTQ